MTNNQPTPRQAALAVLDQFQTTPTSIVNYHASGNVALLGDARAWEGCAYFGAPLNLIGILQGELPAALSANPSIVPVASRAIKVDGYLGHFVISLTDTMGNAQQIEVDAVLDLGDQPVLRRELPPPGYLHSTLAGTDLEALRNDLLGMVGEFEKPKYFNYDPSLCAHGANGNVACHACIDACPAEAIVGVGDKIEVNPHLCQGGGTCASVCPSGAIQYAFPRLADSGNRLRAMLHAFREGGGEQPMVLFHGASSDIGELLDRHAGLLPVVVDEIASVGMDLCLSALVYGAAQVILLIDDEVPPKSVTKLSQQLRWLQAVLEGLGIDDRRVGVARQGEALIVLADPWRFAPALYTMPDNKRTAIFQAVDHLYEQAEKSREQVSLPPGAPFGNVEVNTEACTLCMACVGACPGRALQDGSNRALPELFIIEANCLQCGICTQTCPERALTLVPRLILEREQRNRARVLHQDSPFACISCGKPFAPTSVIHKMTFNLRDHYMFQSPRALDRLKMCEDCRVADIVQDPDAMNGNFDPVKPR